MQAAARLVRRASQHRLRRESGDSDDGGTGQHEEDLQHHLLTSQHEKRLSSADASAVVKPMTPEDSLRAYELFEALRTFEPGASDAAQLLKAVDTYSEAVQPSTSSSSSSSAATPQGSSLPAALHTAIRCAKTGTVDLILRHRPQDINARDPEGATPLHIASSMGRAEVVKLLLAQVGIDDTIKDGQGRTALQVAKGHEVARVIQVSRAQFNETYISLLTSYVQSSSGLSGTTTPGGGQRGSTHSATSPHNHALHLSPHMGSAGFENGSNAVEQAEARDRLVKFLSRGRARSLDFSTLTPGSRGTTVIHEAARRKDVELLKLCQKLGASMVVRDRKGKFPIDVAAKDDAVKGLLRASANSEGRALRRSTSLHGSSAALAALTAAGAVAAGPPTAVEAPAMRGYLSKWTNMARGYKTRWFVLQHGHLSYYRDQEEEGRASRGAISMGIATVEMASDKTTFTVGTTLGKSSRWFLKGNHPVEAMQWVAALKTAIELARGISAHHHQAGVEPPPLPPTPYLGSGSGDAVGLGRSSSTNTSSVNLSDREGGRTGSSLRAVSGQSASASSTDVSFQANSIKPHFPGLNRSTTAATVMSDFDPLTRTPSPQGTEGSILDGEDANGEVSSKYPPHEDSFALLSNSAKTQVTLTEQLLTSLAAAEGDARRRKDIVNASKRSLRMLANMLDTHFEQVQDREKWYTRKYEREIEAKRMWEENMRSVVSSQAELEKELAETQKMSSKRKRALKDLKASVLADLAGSEQGGSSAPTSPIATTRERSDTAKQLQYPSQGGAGGARPDALPLQGGVASPSGIGSGLRSARSVATVQQTVDEVLSDSSSDDDDFYDAVESGAVAVRVETPLATPTHHQDWPKDLEARPDVMQHLESYKGYTNLRDRLPISSDERPPVSLWAILKGSIGKDLTKISFPVYFNEPTSMLQRMAEDMEYSECLDAAAQEEDSLKRLAFVTGFGMSNYASTIGRIAKPFNPMLSETFELVNLDKKYRYVSEQVSHHPPISACIAESPNYHYYGEVDAKNKFLGKSFEIRPTGIAHAELTIPKEWGPDYPPARNRPGYVREHYSWKKVTTSVSNFIMGAPQIDHYGDMEVTNHRTGERCVLTFKPRGWRGNNACELKGVVYDARGTVRWELAGRWNGQLVARKAGAGQGVLNPDDSVPMVGNGSAAASVAPEYLLIWKINQQPPKMPFNLTKFALTLNDANPEIRKYLPPTDCRLRPDQHAFEEGRFEQANELKSALENFQRATRMKRERGELPPHQPRWFTRAMDPDSEQSYWEPARLEDGSLEYWDQRTENWKRVVRGEKPEWKGVEEIFGVTID